MIKKAHKLKKKEIAYPRFEPGTSGTEDLTTKLYVHGKGSS